MSNFASGNPNYNNVIPNNYQNFNYSNMDKNQMMFNNVNNHQNNYGMNMNNPKQNNYNMNDFQNPKSIQSQEPNQKNIQENKKQEIKNDHLQNKNNNINNNQNQNNKVMIDAKNQVNKNYVNNNFPKKRYMPQFNPNQSIICKIVQKGEIIDQNQSNEIKSIVQNYYSKYVLRNDNKEIKTLSEKICNEIKKKYIGEWFVFISDIKSKFPFTLSTVSPSDILKIHIGSSQFSIAKYK